MRKLLYFVLAASMALLASATQSTSQTAKKTTAKKRSKKSAAAKRTTSGSASKTGKSGASASKSGAGATKSGKSGTAASGGTRTAASKKGASKRSPSKAGTKGARTTWRNRQLAPSSDRYREIQNALAIRGYLDPQDATGSWGPNSVDALKRFQSSQNIDATGKIDSVSLIALGLGPKRGEQQASGATGGKAPEPKQPAPE